MYLKYSQGNRIGHSFSKYIVEDEADLTKAPSKCTMGDIVYVVHTGEYWMMDRSKTWYPMTTPNKGPIVCDCIEELTVWNELEE